MNEVDIAILAVIALSFLFGLWRGFFREVLSLLSWVAALVVARLYSQQLAQYLQGMIDSTAVAYVTAFALLFIAVMMLGTLLIFFISKLLSATGLKFADRVFGGCFGIVRGVLIVMLIIFVSSAFLSDSLQWQQSQFIPHGISLIEWSRIFIGDLGNLGNLDNLGTVTTPPI
ncbi:MAG: colicin V production CvpA [SAR86 cluster bacterium]|uniref:Colicin V production CvpA n=1 Tax=SAR86 cluster bacterium TaxID=2030880 RepID=A0A2A4MGE8_9GAMM|nr:MAG: colicin V production CvpA [SAR86 cluster bacterium]